MATTVKLSSRLLPVAEHLSKFKLKKIKNKNLIKILKELALCKRAFKFSGANCLWVCQQPNVY